MVEHHEQHDKTLKRELCDHGNGMYKSPKLYGPVLVLILRDSLSPSDGK